MSITNGTAQVDRRELPIADPATPEVGERAGARHLSRVNDPLIPDASLNITSGDSLKRYSAVAANALVRMPLDVFADGVFWASWLFRENSQNDYDTHPEWRELDTLILDSIRRQTDSFADSTLQDYLRATLDNSRTYGNSVAEFVYDAVPTDGLWMISRLKTFYPYNWDLDVDGFGNLERARFTPEDVDFVGEEIRLKLSITPWPQFQNGNWYGRSDLLSVEKLVARLDALERNMLAGVARLSDKSIIHQYDNAVKADVDDIRSALLKGAQVISFPAIEASRDEGEKEKTFHKIEVLADLASPQGLEEGRQLAEEYRRRITRTLRIGDDLGFTATSVGSKAKAEVQLDVLTLGVISAQVWLKQGMDRQVIPALTRYNFPADRLPPGYHLPEFAWQPLEDDFFEKMAPALVDLVNTGIMTADESREVLGLGPMPEEIESIPTVTEPNGQIKLDLPEDN